jgi:preprotein translocase subunit YajC
MSFFIPEAAAAEAGAGTGTGGFEFILLIGFIAIFYFLIWRPQSKRQKEHRELVGSLSKGDEIVTNGGIMGQITQVRDDLIVVEVADKVELRLQKAAVAATLPKGTLKQLKEA